MGLLGGGGEGLWREGGEVWRTRGGGEDDRLGGERFLYILVGDILWHLMSLGEHNMCKNGFLQGYCRFILVGKWFISRWHGYLRGGHFYLSTIVLTRGVFCVNRQILLGCFSNKKSADKN